MKFIITSSSSSKVYEISERYHELLNESRIEVKTEECMLKGYRRPFKINYVEINTLKELSDIIKSTESSLIISETDITGFDGEIEIYDDYRE
jgi:hypothetical protein